MDGNADSGSCYWRQCGGGTTHGYSGNSENAAMPIGVKSHWKGLEARECPNPGEIPAGGAC